MKVRKIRIAKEVKRSNAGDVSPVAMFGEKIKLIWICIFFMEKN